MATLDVINQTGDVVGSIDLNDEVFGIVPNQQALFDALVMQQAARRQGTASTRGRSEVRGGGRKPYRQKGTGRARQRFDPRSSISWRRNGVWCSS